MTLLEKTRELNKQIESAYIMLGIALSEVQETGAWKELGYETFTEYYQQDLKRNKSTVSKLISVGEWVKEHGFVNNTLPAYNNLYEAILALPDKEPEYVLEFAKSNTLQDIREERQEKAPCEHEWITCCGKCWKRQ